MTELLTAAQMRAIEQAAIDRGEVTGLELMERAGVGVVEAIYEEWPEFSEVGRGASPSRSPEYLGQDEKQIVLRAVVLCGPGNNGGDGFVVARLLHARGWAVEAFLYGDAEKLPPDARVNYERWREIGEISPLDAYSLESWGCDLLVDGLFGIGFSKSAVDLAKLFWNMEDMVDCFQPEIGHEIGRPAVVAIDIPSGICADSGRDFPHDETWYRFSAAAHLTVTFHSPKIGHLLCHSPEVCGKVRVVDIGLSSVTEVGTCSRNALIESSGERRLERVVCTELMPPLSPYLNKGPDEHKFTHGSALILSGGPAQTGAARLAARGALRIGAGLVTLGVPPAAQQEVACQITAIMLKRVKDAEAFAGVWEDKRINALCLGPAFGFGEREAELLDVALQSGRNCVLDADALTLLARGKALFDKLHPGCVLTPHGGEFARLFPDIAEKLAAPASTGPAYSKVDATREAAQRVGCTVLFKGADTVIADQNGRTAVNAAVYERSAPWLATAGSGDVLAGFITGLLARGLSPFDAAQTGAWLHVECALTFGPGLIAEDLPEQLPKVFKDLDQ